MLLRLRRRYCRRTLLTHLFLPRTCGRLQFMADAPWYLNSSAPSLKHQKNWKDQVGCFMRTGWVGPDAARAGFW